jgi:hypothetical protein
MSTPRPSKRSEPQKAPKHGARSVIPTTHEKSDKNTRAEFRREESQARPHRKRECEARKSQRSAPIEPTPSRIETGKERGPKSKTHREQPQPPGPTAARIQPSDQRRR